MSFHIRSEAVPNNVQILHLIGKVTQGDGAETLRETLKGISKTPGERIILDLSEVSYIDSTGIGEFVSAFFKAHESGQTIVLAALSERLEDLLKLTKLDKVFEVYESVEAARATAG